MKNTPMFRQGDVLITRVSSIPTGATVREKDRGHVVLAYGEVTGHSHHFAPEAPVALLDAPEIDGAREVYLRVDALSQLVHEEHGAIALDAGTYRITRQREYTPERIVTVAD